MNRVAKLVVVSSVLLVVSFSLLFLTVNKRLDIPYVSNGIHTALSYVNGLLSKPVRFFSEQRDVIAELIETYDENKELKASLRALDGRVADLDTVKKENDSLRETLGMTEQYAEKQFIAGLVSVRTPVSWNTQLTIDLGKKDGLTEEMLVVSNGGLVGTIEHIYEDVTDVKLLSNSDKVTKIPVKIATGTTDIYGILTGYDTDTNSFIVSQLNSADAIAVGSNVVTSDLAGTTPSNIQIGKVRTVRTSSSDLSRELYIEPTANFSNIYSVLVVGDRK
ncbi:rod shape-determining protein MreC [Streptococcus azizii]|uniref:Cell shape-determining protein MreC n=1 Tax=Streptococcus azizii TaxID=1579424 RepID=A0AB36JNK3_9STRE|nr:MULTISPECIES: rod shape-determining protein MreC [Streptococcus]MBF0776634.1 rod shape-determining protein MreC [Streptococcus sp. 19428wD3_AN2]ONK25905.1 rod shape-determining protein MreC [Streptococcus azizii]ONK26291.1 rod shape-determining protein MreC [Streptococcus azizii]ONK27017.1 rod shape-determining protein MreC [Streptococcus azizii]TFU82585.1 rod shape-determining protein MreC [Streptococcus sp. AN2]